MKIIDQTFALLTLLIVVAIIAVLVSNRAQTAQVIQAFASAMSNLIGTVVSPLNGSSDVAQKEKVSYNSVYNSLFGDQKP